MIRNTFLILVVSMFTNLTAVSCTAWPRQYYDNEVSDQEYIHIAGKTDEARAFLEQFPEAGTLVDRSSKLAVDFHYDKVLPAATEQSWEGIRLRVFINPETKLAGGAFIQCSDHSGQTHFVEVALIEYLQQYVQSQRCP